MNIIDENYSVSFAPDTNILAFRGTCRLWPDDYNTISEAIAKIVDQAPPILTLDLRELEYLNSSGISMLTSFIINVRKKGTTQLVVKGSKEFPWQNYSLRNFQRLLPSLQLEMK